MIRYACGGNAGEWYCYMSELWNDYGTVVCETVLQVPGHEMSICVILFGKKEARVVVLPDFRLSFYRYYDESFSECAATLQAYGINCDIAASIAKTIETMDDVVDGTCEIYDSTCNLAEVADNMPFYEPFTIYKMDDEEELPF